MENSLKSLEVFLYGETRTTFRHENSTAVELNPNEIKDKEHDANKKR